MTDAAVETNRERVSRRQVDKFAERRAQLADAALQTLAELGYARTSLREIAQNTEFSHGVLHYYFSDKEDLITHCVRQYEAACVTRYDEIVASASSGEELKREFSAAMAQTLRTDAPLFKDVSALEWRGPTKDFEAWAKRMEAPRLLERCEKAAIEKGQS